MNKSDEKDELAHHSHKPYTTVSKSLLTDFGEIVENSPLLICTYQSDYILTYINEKYCRFFHKERNELIGTDFRLLIPPEHREGVTAIHESISPQSPTVTHEHKVLSSNDMVAWQRWSIRGLFDESDQIIGFQAFGEDITDKKETEAKLFLMDSVVEQSFDGHAIIDLENNLVYLNDAFAEMHGYDRDEMLGKNLNEFHSKEQMQEVKKVSDGINKSGHFHGELGHRKKNGSLFVGLVNYRLLEDDNNEVVGIIKNIQDITPLKETETALKESLESFAYLFDQAPIGLIYCSFIGEVLAANRRAFELLGYDNEEYDINILSFSNILNGTKSDMKYLLVNMLDGKIDTFSSESEYVDKNGKSGYGFTRFRVIHSSKNEPQKILVTIEDITDRKRYQQELKFANEKLEDKVKERTEELEKLNVALEVLINRSDSEKAALEQGIAATAEISILPFIGLLKESDLTSNQKALITSIEKAVRELISPYTNNLTKKLSILTAREKSIALLIKDGLTNAEVSEALSVSEHAVAFHRQNIRKKLGLKRSKLNLASYLQGLPED